MKKAFLATTLVLMSGVSWYYFTNGKDEEKLYAAVMDRDIGKVTYLLQNGANPFMITLTGWTAFHAVAHTGSLGIAGLLFEHSDKKIGGLDTPDKNGFTSLMIASNHGFNEIAELLIAQGAKLSSRSKTGATALHISARAPQEHLETVKLLISNGAEIDSRDLKNSTPLMFAASQNHRDLVWYLVSKGADVLAKDNEGNSAKDYAKAGSEIRSYLELETKNKTKQ